MIIPSYSRGSRAHRIRCAQLRHGRNGAADEAAV